MLRSARISLFWCVVTSSPTRSVDAAGLGEDLALGHRARRVEVVARRRAVLSSAKRAVPSWIRTRSSSMSARLAHRHADVAACRVRQHQPQGRVGLGQVDAGRRLRAPRRRPLSVEAGRRRAAQRVDLEVVARCVADASRRGRRCRSSGRDVGGAASSCGRRRSSRRGCAATRCRSSATSSPAVWTMPTCRSPTTSSR